MELRGTEAWTCRMWYLIALGVVILATVFSMQYKNRMLEHYAKERLHTYLCCKQNVVTGHTNFIYKDQKIMAILVIEKMIRTGDFSYAEIAKYRELMKVIAED